MYVLVLKLAGQINLHEKKGANISEEKQTNPKCQARRSAISTNFLAVEMGDFAIVSMKTKSVHTILMMLKTVTFATQNLFILQNKICKFGDFCSFEHSLENLEVGAQKDLNDEIFSLRDMIKEKDDKLKN